MEDARIADTIGDRIFTVSATCQVLELECLYYTYDGKIRNPTGGKMWDGICINCKLRLRKDIDVYPVHYDFSKRGSASTGYCQPVQIDEAS